MGGEKLERRVEVNQAHLDWLREMADSYNIDQQKALRVVLDYAMNEADQHAVFTEIRCHHC